MTTVRTTPSPNRLRPPRRRTTAALAVAAALLAALAACTTPDPGSTIPGATGSSDPAAAPSASAIDPEEAMLQWARCMRENGVDVPDPSDGRVTVNGEGVSPEQLEAAESACEQWQRAAEPPDGGNPIPAEQKQAFLDQAQCMRDRGWNVPDPTFEGGRVGQTFKRGAEPAPGDPAPGDPTFEADLQECADEAGLKLPGDEPAGQE